MKHKLLLPFLSVNMQITHYYNTEKGECLYNLSFRSFIHKCVIFHMQLYNFRNRNANSLLI